MTDKRPLPMVVLTANGIQPVTAYDAECLSNIKHGQVFDLKAHSKRSNPQLRLYWQALSNVVKATGKWPTSEHLHRELKMACGYVDNIIDWGGKVHTIPDSIAFAKMNHDEFRIYFDTAIAKMAERVGFDPLEEN